MAPTALVLDSKFELHDTGPSHPEAPERVSVLVSSINPNPELCCRINPQAATIDELRLFHTENYLGRLLAAAEDQLPFIDTPDSAICSASVEIATLAAGSVIAATEAVVSGKAKNAFCAIRPPGHHAECDRSMGFCLFNNVALAALHAKTQGVERILIFDWDVHHGNGTQHAFESDPQLFFCSIHGHPHTLYPGTGFAHEQGKGEAQGTTLNIPMRPGSDGTKYRQALTGQFFPAAIEFHPDLIFISAGFDAHRLDPIGNQNLETEDFAWLTEELLELAARLCSGRVVSVLEGGYNLDALKDAVGVHYALLEGA